MIDTSRALSIETDYTEPFEDRVDILYRELELAIKWQRPSILLAIYSSEYVHADADIALENRLADLGQRAYHIKIKNKDDANVASLVSELANVKNVTFFIEGLRWGEQDNVSNVYCDLNTHREFFIENQVRVIFWLTENEAVDFAHYAPDCWAFRHRVIEFVDAPRTEQISPRLLESACQGVEDPSETIEDLDAKIAFRTALLTDLPDGNESTAARANLLLTLGILHWRRGDYERATQFLNSTINLAVKLQDDCFEALCYNAIALVETDLGRYDEAIQAYQRAIALAPEKISPWNNLGNLYCKLGQFEDAVKAFQKAIEQNAGDAISWNGLGDVYQKLGRNDDAIYAYLKTIEIAPNFAKTWSSLGKSYTKDERLEDAFSAHKKALEIDRYIISSWIGLGEISRRQGREDNAVQAYQMAVELDPKNAQAWNELGDLYYHAQADEKAFNAYQRAIDLGQACSQSYNNLASIFVQKGNDTETISLLIKGIELSNSTTERILLWNRLGDTYRRLSDYDNAIAAYRNADELDPNAVKHREEPPVSESESPKADPEEDQTELISAQPSELEEETQGESSNPDLTSKSEKVEPPAETVETRAEVDFAEWLNNLGTTLSDPEQATESVFTNIETKEVEETEEGEINPDILSSTVGNIETEGACWVFNANHPASQDTEGPSNTDAASPVILGSRILSDESVEIESMAIPDLDSKPAQVEETGQTPVQNKEQDGAEQNQTDMDIKNAQIWNELGNIYFNSGKYDEATQAFYKAIELDPNYGWSFYNLASLHVHKGQYADAIPLYKKGISFLTKGKDKALLWNRLGDAYRRLDDSDNAMVAYQKALELDSDKTSLLKRARLSLLGNCRA
jgi:tetratricopeptide (TPR) repeat protein